MRKCFPVWPVLVGNPIRLASGGESGDAHTMADVLILLWSALTGLFRSRARLETEILVLRQQINVLRRKSPKKFVFSNFDRLVLVGLWRLVPGTVDALAIVRPETVICWHRCRAQKSDLAFPLHETG
jgi:hypothetical protein